MSDEIEWSGVAITERENDLTRDMDFAKNGQEIVKLFAKTDAEIFAGWEFGEKKKTSGLNDEKILNKLGQIVKTFLAEFNSSKKAKIILSGCGTSGRLAYFTSQAFNEHLAKLGHASMADYVIAGDELALVNSVESIEDRPDIGVQKLKEKLVEPGMKILFIGISCGFSAPFVAGQLEYCLGHADVIGCAVIGFNPVELAKQNSIFKRLLNEIRRREFNEPHKYFLVNPLIGPEPVSGSTRMKSGTATKILLDIIFAQIVANLEKVPRLNELETLKHFEDFIRTVIYSEENLINVGKLIDMSVGRLRTSHSVNYFSDSERLGLIACIDASECVPTFGSRDEDFNGFVTVTKNTHRLNQSLNQAFPQFIRNCHKIGSSNLNVDAHRNSLFIVIKECFDERNGSNLNLDRLIDRKFIERNFQHVKLEVAGLGGFLAKARKEMGGFLSERLEEIGVKLVCNAVSTGAFVLFGKIYGNLMIDVRISNEKLYWRAVAILKRLVAEKTFLECEEVLLSAIFKRFNTEKERVLNETSVMERVEVASERSFIVPRAVLMCLASVDYEEADRLLRQSNYSVRDCILSTLKK